MGSKMLNLKWRQMWVSHLGCIKGCLEYLNLDVSDAWLFGATGYAFIVNIHEEVCPSGPTAWNTEMLFKLGKNVGYTVDGVFSRKSHSDFAEKQQLAWEKTRQAIDEGLPCYGWELDIPEFYVVNGYDENGYYFSGPTCDSGGGPKPWNKLGDTDIGLLEIYSVKLGDAADDNRTIMAALGFALEHSESPAKWIFPRELPVHGFPKYKAGLGGFDNWIRALRTGKADGFGMAYNAAVWSECRSFAVEFLEEAKERSGRKLGSLFDEAAEHYEVVAQSLRRVSEMFPFPPRGGEMEDTTRCATALKDLASARKAEQAGLISLEKIVNAVREL